jgi:hypothetical protein
MRAAQSLRHDREGPVANANQDPPEDQAMLKTLAAGLITAAIVAAPMLGSISLATPAAAAITHKNPVDVQRKHVRKFRLVQCYLTRGQARHVKLHKGNRLQRVACYLPAQTKQAKLHGRHPVKHVKLIKQARHVRHAKTGHTG